MRNDKELNEERVPTRSRLRGGWNVSTISRLSKRKQVRRAADEWVTRDRPEMRIISDET